MTWDRTQLRNGMHVYSADGEKLGKVVECREDGFVIEKGFFFPKDYLVRYSDVADLRGDDAWLSLGRSSLAAGGTGTAVHQADSERDRTRGGDVRVPLAEEEIEVEKRMRQAGEVRVHKEVQVEHREVTVPVTREEVRVERVPASAATSATPGDAAFEAKTISVPVMEEEVEIRKRPVVKEEVRIRRERVQDERRADTEVRRETAEIEDTSTRERLRDEDDVTLRSPPSRDDLP